MKSLFVCLVIVPLAIPVCQAAAVVGCRDESGVTYQSTPCPDDAATIFSIVSISPPSVSVEAAAARKTELGVTADAIPAPRRRAALNSSRDELHAGMSDLQVLNNRRWGKPQRITRNREARAWHELWRYETGANGGKQLRFVNGKLAHIEALEAPLPVVSVASASVSEERP